MNREKIFDSDVSIYGGLVLSSGVTIYGFFDNVQSGSTGHDILLTQNAVISYFLTNIPQDYSKITNEPTGLPNRTDSTLGITGNTFTITPTGVSFDYWISGTKYTSTGATVNISSTEGTHFIYFDTDGVLKTYENFNIELIYTKAYVAVIYWDSTNNKFLLVGDERHGLVMDGRTHAYLHLKEGTAYMSGLGLGNFSLDGSGDVNIDAQFSCGNGEIWDEDIQHLIVDGSPQDLSPILNAPVFYLSGDTKWRRKDPSPYPVISYNFNSSNRLAYNSFSGGLWDQTQVGTNDFVLTHIFATNDIYTPIIAIQGQSDYTTLSNARQGANTELSNLITTGLPVQEFIPVATIIYKTSNIFDNAVKAKVVSTDLGDPYVNWIGQSLSPTSAPNDHGLLSGLNDDDHLQYALLSGRNSTDVLKINNLNTFSGSEINILSGVRITGATILYSDLILYQNHWLRTNSNNIIRFDTTSNSSEIGSDLLLKENSSIITTSATQNFILGSSTIFRGMTIFYTITQGSNYEYGEYKILNLGSTTQIAKLNILKNYDFNINYTSDINSNNLRLNITNNEANAITFKYSLIRTKI